MKRGGIMSERSESRNAKNRKKSFFVGVLICALICSGFHVHKVEAHALDYLAGTYLATAPCNQTNLKPFVLEVGHALKLGHPAIGTSMIGHSVNGHPVAIMNQGLPNGADVASTIQTHDITNLKAKWGN